MPLPVASFDKLKTLLGRNSIIQLKWGVNKTLALLVEYVTDASTLDIGRMPAPGAGNGPSYTGRTWLKSRGEMWKLRCKEIKKIYAEFGTLSFHEEGTASMYIRDPKDAEAKVGLSSEVDFAAAFYRDPAEVAHSGDAVSEVTIVIESLKDGPVTMTPDADIPA